MSVLSRDKELSFPHYTILKASAGAGKTRALTERYVQFLLSDKIPFNNLKNILAITFSNNAAREMKERILLSLKKLAFSDPEAISAFSGILSLSPEQLSSRAKNAIEEILNNYSEFQVKTIDSFMTTLFRAGAIAFGYPPDFEIVMNNDDIITYSFDLYLRDLRGGNPEAEWFEDIVDKLSEGIGTDSAYLWDPYYELLKRLKDIYSEESSSLKELYIDISLQKNKLEIENKLLNLMEEIKREVDNSGLSQSRNCPLFKKFDWMIQNRDFRLFFEMGTKNLPVKKEENSSAYEHIQDLWNSLKGLIDEYAICHSRIYFQHYIEVFKKFKTELNMVKLTEGKAFMEDINKKLSGHIRTLGIPEIYFRLGEKIYHFLIDEFQDTSPVQWNNLLPLIENALSGSGSLFVVGDTKQSIYGFRKADYRIMRQLEHGELFPSARKELKELDLNFRSGEEIVKFNEMFFKDIIGKHERLSGAALLSGLTEYNQYPHKDKKNSGYVRLKIYDNDSRDSIKHYIISIINKLLSRGYKYEDIAILAFRNEEVIEITRWLNESNIPLISFSSLDVRKRKVTDEIIHLLNFLDSPVNNFHFAVFISGSIYKNYLMNTGAESSERAISPSVQEVVVLDDLDRFLLKHRQARILYKEFQKDFPNLWKRDFENLFRLTGYLPLYDLMSICLSTFRVFDIMPEEEATFIKILELVRSFENRGYSSIKNFMEFLSSKGEDDRIWNISLPSGFDAVRLMTVHKAKGLQFPVTIVYVSRADRNYSEYYIEEVNEGIRLLKINKELSQRSGYLEEIRNRHFMDKLTGKLNTLYVAFTRPERELYIIGNNASEDFPYGLPLNGDNEFIVGEISEISDIKNSVAEVRVEESTTVSAPIIDAGFKIKHYCTDSDFPVDRTQIHIIEKQRGEFIHRILSSIEYLDEKLSLDLKDLWERLILDYPLLIRNKKGTTYEEMDLILRRLFETELKQYFLRLPGRIIKNEFNLADPSGNVCRPDRVIIDADVVTIIDYKTGVPTSEEIKLHKDQILHYKRIVQGIYPERLVQGFLYYIDSNEILKV